MLVETAVGNHLLAVDADGRKHPKLFLALKGDGSVQCGSKEVVTEMGSAVPVADTRRNT